MARPRHSNKHIEKAVQYAETQGWRFEKASGHAWGHLLCPHATRQGCLIGVWSTPRNPENHARHIRRDVDQCPHTHEEVNDGDENNQSRA